SRGVVGDALHRQQAVAGRRAAEAAAVEADDLVGIGERGHLRLPHGEAERKGVEQKEGGPGAAHLARQLRPGHPQLPFSFLAAPATAWHRRRGTVASSMTPPAALGENTSASTS